MRFESREAYIRAMLRFGVSIMALENAMEAMSEAQTRHIVEWIGRKLNG